MSTVDHDEIRRWSESRDGAPARLRGGHDGGEDLRIELPWADQDEDLEPLGWDKWFEVFEDSHLAAVFLGDPTARDDGLIVLVDR